jgi:hypothetical protein
MGVAGGEDSPLGHLLISRCLRHATRQEISETAAARIRHMPQQREFTQGDKVEWETSQGTTSGTVQKRITETTQIDGHTAKATKDDPQYVVKSDKTGALAAHKPGSLKKKS